MAARVVNMVAGIWLVVAAWILEHPGPMAQWNDTFMGIGIFLFAALSLAAGGLQHVNTVLGAWLVLAPGVYGYSNAAAAANDIIVGLIVFAASLFPTKRTSRAGFWLSSRGHG